ncbi:MAG: hypothetical protein HBSAPP03_28900 [Phycisphaerae bacterium]|nr:MAG: hypothetical protein HBSAPP03_28900 [Phycisphaerae bacterium]
MEESMLHQRLRGAVGRRSYRELADMTHTHPETVRRYLLGHTPSVEFLTHLSHGLNLNGEWLLTGRGPMNASDVRPQALREANPSELLNAVAATLERLIQRVERLELFVQTMEVRLRAREGGLPSSDGPSAAAQAPAKVARIADAIPRRSSPDAR